MTTLIFSQQYNIGTPVVQSYSRDIYQAGTQNWNACLAFDNKIAWCNNDGLLTFDGQNWDTYPVPNKTIVRSAAYLNDHIFVGAQDEVGYFAPNKNGILVFESIKESIAEANQGLTDIWDMCAFGQDVVFRANNAIFRYDQDSTRVIFSAYAITFLNTHKETAYFNDLSQGLFKYTKDKATKIPGSEILMNIPIIDMIPLNNGHFYILTEKQGIYYYDGQNITSWTTNAADYLTKNRISAGKVLSNDNLALGTFLGGLVIINPEGTAIHKIDKSNGLQNNNINVILEDDEQNIWLGTYNGIDKVMLGSGVTQFSPDGDKEGAIFDIAKIYGKFFFGTNTGLYYIDTSDYFNPFNAKDFKLVPNTQGQVWGLDIIDDVLILSHGDGAFLINDQLESTRLSSVYGSWKCVKLDEDHMLQGSYGGLHLYTRSQDGWELTKAIPNFSESSRFIVHDQHKNIWVTHPYRGIFKISYADQFQEWKVEKLEAPYLQDFDSEAYVMELNNDVCLSNKNGLFRYNQEQGLFSEMEEVQSLFSKPIFIKRLIKINNKYWYIADEETGVITQNKNGLSTSLEKTSYSALQQIFVGGFENLFPLNEDEVYACTNEGVEYINTQELSGEPDKSPYFVNVSLPIRDSTIFGGYGPSPAEVKLKANENNISFHFSILSSIKNIKYKYRLEGLEKEYANWTEINFKEYTNLDDGEYTFELVSSLAPDQIKAFNFTIKPAWYETLVAKILYALIALGIVAWVLLFQRLKYKKTEAEMLLKQEQTEAEIEKLKTEKLESDILFKNKELASSTLHLLQKNETLDIIRTELEKVQRNIKDPQARKEVKKIGSLLRSDLRLENDWSNFSIHFDSVHHDFIKRIKKDYPELSTKDQKLCAYLRMNLQTKEIAPLLNISVRGVEISRYRLRKKLGIEKEVNLNEFMMAY